MIIIRADANKNIGIGHVMRCLSIAKALVNAGVECLFVTADHDGDVLIKQNGFTPMCLNSLWNDLKQEIDCFCECIREYSPFLVIVDTYYVTFDYFYNITKYSKVAYIDDMNSMCWPIDILINYNTFAGVYDYSWYENQETELLLNPQFAPLRSEFSVCSRHIIKDTEHILFSAGGADPENITERLIHLIEKRRAWDNISFHFVIGALNPRLEAIRKLGENRNNFILHVNEKNMSGLMNFCDIAISAAGTTLYELCASGIPSITYTLADNQIVAAEQFEAQGIMISAGDCRENSDFIEILGAKLDDLINDRETRQKLSTRMQQLVDGKGTKRLVRELLKHR